MASDDCQEKPPGLSLKGCNILGIFSPRNEEVKKEKISQMLILIRREELPSVAISPVHEGDEEEEEQSRHLQRKENITRL